MRWIGRHRRRPPLPAQTPQRFATGPQRDPWDAYLNPGGDDRVLVHTRTMAPLPSVGTPPFMRARGGREKLILASAGRARGDRSSLFVWIRCRSSSGIRRWTWARRNVSLICQSRSERASASADSVGRVKQKIGKASTVYGCAVRPSPPRTLPVPPPLTPLTPTPRSSSQTKWPPNSSQPATNPSLHSTRATARSSCPNSVRPFPPPPSPGRADSSG